MNNVCLICYNNVGCALFSNIHPVESVVSQVSKTLKWWHLLDYFTGNWPINIFLFFFLQRNLCSLNSSSLFPIPPCSLITLPQFYCPFAQVSWEKKKGAAAHSLGLWMSCPDNNIFIWPVSGTSVGLIILLICSMDCKSGERPCNNKKMMISDKSSLKQLKFHTKRTFHSPPWQQKIFSSTMAAIGKQLKQSVNVFQSLMLYRRLPVKLSWRQQKEIKYKVANYLYTLIWLFGNSDKMWYLNLTILFGSKTKLINGCAIKSSGKMPSKKLSFKFYKLWLNFLKWDRWSGLKIATNTVAWIFAIYD